MGPKKEFRKSSSSPKISSTSGSQLSIFYGDYSMVMGTWRSPRPQKVWLIHRAYINQYMVTVATSTFYTGGNGETKIPGFLTIRPWEPNSFPDLQWWEALPTREEKWLNEHKNTGFTRDSTLIRCHPQVFPNKPTNPTFSSLTFRLAITKLPPGESAIFW